MLDTVFQKNGIDARRAADRAAFAALRSPYADDEFVAEHTRQIIASAPDALLQVHRLAPDPLEHVRELLIRMAPSPCVHILDVGCGVGACAALLKELRPDLVFTLLNVSAAQLAMCPPQFAKLHADMHAIPAPDGAFDVAMYCYSLGHGLLEKALPEAARVLAPGGVLFIYDLTSEAGDALARLGYRAHAKSRIDEEAEAAGFRADCSEQWELDLSHIARLIGGAQARELFSGARALMCRFLK